MRRTLSMLAATALFFLFPLASPATADTGMEPEFLRLANQERAAQGLSTLSVAGDLVDYARHHSAVMNSEQTLRHSSELRTLTNWDMLGENVGRGGSVQALHDAFMASPSHRENVLKPNFSEVGIGVVVADGTIWVTFVFRDPATPAVAPPASAPPGVVDMISTPDGGGYWLVTGNGEVRAYGDAPALGGVSHLSLKAPIVGSASTPSGHGYWLVASDGGIFSFGDAAFFGSTGSIRLNQPIEGMTPTDTGTGYWMVAKDGGIFSFGDAGFLGSKGGSGQSFSDMTSVPGATGYWLVSVTGEVFTFGAAAYLGSF